MSNLGYYGFRVHRAEGSDIMANIEPMKVATAYQAQDDLGGFSVDLQIGDPVDLVAAGTVGLANGGETPYGIVMGVLRYHDGNDLKIGGKRLPGGTTWTQLQYASWVQVIPVSKCDWKICCDSLGTPPTTEVGWQALVGKNAVHTCVGVAATKDANPKLDNTTAVTAVHEWRIMSILPGQDYDAANVEVVVRANFSSEPGWAATPSVGV